MLTIHENILPKSAARPVRALRKFSGVTIHETGNTSSTADAAAHDRYMHINGGKNSYVSYHYVVDDKQAYHFIPDNEVAWHAGDGSNGRGNCETVAIEICVNSGGDFTKATLNSAELAAKILYEHQITTVIDGTIDKTNGNLFQHNTFSSYRKNCPYNIRTNGLWGNFVKDVQQKLNNMWIIPETPNNPPYRVRLSVNDSKSQIGAFSMVDNAINYAKNNDGYSVFDSLGNKIY